MCQIDRKVVLQQAGGGKKLERERETDRAVLLMTGRMECKDHSHSEGGQGIEGMASRGRGQRRRRREVVWRCKHTDQGAAANLPAVIQQFDDAV